MFHKHLIQAEKYQIDALIKGGHDHPKTAKLLEQKSPPPTGSCAVTHWLSGLPPQRGLRDICYSIAKHPQRRFGSDLGKSENQCLVVRK